MEANPLFPKICFCIPLKTWLYTSSWMIFKIVFNLGLIFIMGFIMFTSFAFEPIDTQVALTMILSFIVAAVDMIFVVVLSVGLCVRNVPAVTVFYYYNLAMIVIVFGILVAIGTHLCVNPSEIRTQFRPRMIGVTYLAISLFLDIFMALTVKSDLIKLREETQVETSEPLKTDSQKNLLRVVPNETQNLVHV